MECPEIKERISAYVDGEADSADASEVRAHLDECAACRGLERRMRSLGEGISRIEAAVPPDFREKLFARMEKEELLPRRRSLFVFSLRWVAVPLTAAAALALFLLTVPEKERQLAAPRGAASQAVQPEPVADPGSPARPGATSRAPLADSGAPRKARPPAVAAVPATARVAGDLSPEERDIVANLDLLEDSTVLDEPGEVDELEIFGQASRGRG